jgi:hypothetical protein
MEINVGLPPMLMMAANHYPYRIIHERVKLTIPRKGSYKDIDEAFFADNPIGMEEFDIFDEETKVFFPSQITKVLLATKKYPSLQANEVFVPLAIIFKEETLDIIGTVFEMLDHSVLDEGKA